MTRALAVMLPVHKREKVAQIAANGLERILGELQEAGIESRVLVVGNEDWAQKMAQSKGWSYLRQNNASVGSKFDAGARYIVDKWGQWATHFMEFCSDNILSTDFTELVKASIFENKDHSVTTNAFYILNSETQEVRLFHLGVGTNVGRVTKMSVVRAMRNRGDGKLFCHGIKRGLDRSFRVRMQKVTARRPRLHDIAVPYIIDVKDRDSMHGWHRFASKPEQFPLVEIEGNFPELHQLLNLWQPQAKSEATPSTSTSAPSRATASTQTPPTTPSTSSPAQPAAPSAESSKRSTPQPKTTTARAASSSPQSTGASAAKASSTSATTPTSSDPPSSSTSGTTRPRSASRGRQASQATLSTTATATSPATKKAQDSTKSPASASPSKATAASKKRPSTQARPSTTRNTSAKKKRRK